MRDIKRYDNGVNRGNMSYNPEKPQFWQPFSLGRIPYYSVLDLSFSPFPRKVPVPQSTKSNFDIGSPYPGAIVYPEYSEDEPIHELLEIAGLLLLITFGIYNLQILN